MTWQAGDSYTLATLGWLKQAAAGGVSDAGSISLSLISSTSVTIAFTKPADTDFASAILYRRLPGGAFAAVHTYTDSGSWTDTGLTAKTTYTYVAVSKNADGVNGPPTREAAIRTVTSAAVSGLYSIPIDGVKTLIANCPAAQTFLGVASEADALLKIYEFMAGEMAEGAATSTSAGKLVDAGAAFVANGVLAGDAVVNATDDTATTVSSVDSQTQLTLAADIFTSGEAYVVSAARPLIVVYLPDDGVGHTIEDAVLLAQSGNRIEVLFEKDIGSGDEAPGQYGPAWYSFSNELGAIAQEMLELAGVDDGVHVYFPIRAVNVVQGPSRPGFDAAAAGRGNFYQAVLSVGW